MVENSETPANADDVWTVRRILDWTAAHLEKHGSETPRLDAEILLAHARGCRRIDLYTRYAEPLTDEQRAAMRGLVKRRANAEPVAYLVGHREFFSLNFKVTPDVLVPRPDTETLVVELIDRAKPVDAPKILDIGTGSGCIAVTVATHIPAAIVTAIDLSEAALDVARENATTHQVAERITFIQSDLFSALPDDARFDFIVSNPPYIREDEMPTLPPDVRLHEPNSALVAGADGLSILRRIISDAKRYLVPGGHLLLECAHEQAAAVRDLMKASGDFEEITLVNDLTHRPRAVCARRSSGR